MTLYTAEMKTTRLESAMAQANALFEASGISLDELGKKMGYEKNPRQSAWQFLTGTKDPRLSMLIRFADALDISLAELVTDPKSSRSKK